jgi:hypothetical protein
MNSRADTRGRIPIIVITLTGCASLAFHTLAQ